MKHTSLFLKASSCLSFALLLACPAGMQAGNVPGEPVAPPCSLPAGIIRFNQVGYYPNQEKVVTVNEGAVESFALVDAATGRTVFSGSAAEAIRLFPTKVNVTVAASRASVGPENMQVSIQSTPGFVGDTQRVEIKNDQVHAVVDIYSATSDIAGWSVVSTLINIASPIVF